MPDNQNRTTRFYFMDSYLHSGALFIARDRPKLSTHVATGGQNFGPFQYKIYHKRMPAELGCSASGTTVPVAHILVLPSAERHLVANLAGPVVTNQTMTDTPPRNQLVDQTGGEISALHCRPKDGR